MQTVLITGGSGYLGRYLLPRAAETYEVIATYHTQPIDIEGITARQVDLTSREATFALVTELQPDAIIHTAAVNPGQADEATMLAVNVEGSRHIAEAAKIVRARLVHLSTDVIHDGKRAPYYDEDLPSPLNAYGRSKALAEDVVRYVWPSAAIVRTSLIYGLDVMDRGTAGLVEKIQRGEDFILFSDVFRQPIYAETLCKAILKLLDLEASGTFNIVGGQALTREAYAKKLFDFWGVAYEGKVKSGLACEISDTIPLDLRMSTAKAEQTLGMTFPGVDAVIAGYEKG